MNRLLSPALAFLLLAGCTGPADDPVPYSRPAVALLPDSFVRIDASAEGMHALVDLDRVALVGGRAVLQVPGGEWAIVRLVVTPDMWGSEGAWDGEGQIAYGLMLEAAAPTDVTFLQGMQYRDGTDAMPAFVFVGSVPVDDEPLMGGGGMSVRSSGTEAPRPEFAFLLGSDEDLTLSIAVYGDSWPEDLEADMKGRTRIAVAPDAIGASFFSGTYFRTEGFGGETFEWASGSVAYEEDSAAKAGTVHAVRQSRLHGEAEATRAGIAALATFAADLAGHEEWQLTFDAAGSASTTSGEYVAPGLLLPGLRPAGGWIQTTTEAGDVAFALERTFTGASLGHSLAIWGHASVDLADLYGWRMEDMPRGDRGAGLAWSACLPGLPCVQA